MNIAFFDAKPYDSNSFQSVNESYGYNIKYFESHLTEDNISLTKGFDALCIFVNDIITAGMMETLYQNGIRLIALRCAGYNNVDFKSAYGKIHIVRVPAYSPHAIAEHALALMMTLNRKTHRAFNRTRESNFTLSGLMGFDMYGKTAGVVGTGKIGRELIKILRGLGMRVLTYDPYPNMQFAEESGCVYTDLDTLFPESMVISLNCPLTKETEYLINKESISKMQDGVMLINTGRGKLINTADLIDGLKAGKIGAAGLDVYEEESQYFFEDHSDRILSDDILARLLTFHNVLITSHQAFFTHEAVNEIAQVTLSNIKTYQSGGFNENEICYHCELKGTPDCLKDKGKPCF